MALYVNGRKVAGMGKAGKDGEPGAAGKSAYDLAKEGGYTGTEADFKEAMKNFGENFVGATGSDVFLYIGPDGSVVPKTAEEVGAMLNVSAGESVSKTLTTSWTEQSDGTFAQTISVDGVTGEDSQPIVVDIDLDGTDIDADIAVMEAWGCVNRCDPGSGTLKFVCYGDTPTVAIPLNVVVM